MTTTNLDPQFDEDGNIIITDELALALQLDQAELLEEAEAAIRWLTGDMVAQQLEDTYELDEVPNDAGQEVFKAALLNNPDGFPAPTRVLQAIARAFGLDTAEVFGAS
jgi:hypothetical protein